MDDIRASMSKEDSRKKPEIENAMGEYCSNKDNKLTAREKKICYYIDPSSEMSPNHFLLECPP